MRTRIVSQHFKSKQGLKTPIPKGGKMLKARNVFVVAIVTMMVSVAATSPAEAQLPYGFYRIDSNTATPTIQLVTETQYTDVGKASEKNAHQEFVGALAGGGLEYIEGNEDLTNPTWTFEAIAGTAGTQYSRATANRSGAYQIHAAREGLGLDYVTGGPGAWSVTNAAAGVHYNDVSPGGEGYFVYLAPDSGSSGAHYVRVDGAPGGTLNAGRRYTDQAIEVRDANYASYGSGADGLDYVGWTPASPAAGQPGYGNITTTRYNDITGIEQGTSINGGARTVFGAVTGGGIESYHWNGASWQQTDITTAGNTEYSVLWYDWGSPFNSPYDPQVLYAAGAQGGLWKIDANNVNAAVQLVDTASIFTVLVGDSHKGGIVYGAVPEPASLVLVGMGMISLSCFTFRRRRNKPTGR